MTRRTCVVLGVLMITCAVVALLLSLTRPEKRELQDSVAQLNQSQAEQDEELDRQRRVMETVAILECRRRQGAGTCPTVNGRHGGWGECTRAVVINGVRRNQSCGTR